MPRLESALDEPHLNALILQFAMYGNRLISVDRASMTAEIEAGAFGPQIEEALAQRLADLYLLADIDVPWVPDGDQRDRPERREEMQELFRRTLAERGARVVELRGSRDERFATAKAAIDELASAD